MDKPNKSVYALFGGTFDPPHLGHLLPLIETANILGLSQIALLPAHVPALKNKVTPVEHRLAMTKLLCAMDDRLSIDLSEIERTETSYTVNTLALIKQQKPAHTLIFIMGIDSLKNLHSWHRWESLFDYCHIIVMARPPLDELVLPASVDTMDKTLASNLYNFYTTEHQFNTLVGSEMDEKFRFTLLSKLAQAESGGQSMHQRSFMDIMAASAMGKLWFVNNKHCSVSSSLIRQRLSAGKNVQNWVPNRILKYINKHQLYQ